MLYFVRHGQSDKNKAGIFRHNHGDDSHLTPAGTLQAQKTADDLAHIKFDAIYSSPILRAIETCKIIAGNMADKIIIDERLVERDYGEFIGKRYKHTADGPPDFDSHAIERYDLDPSINVETLESVEARLYDFIREMNEKYPDKNVLAVTHGSVIRVAETHKTGRPVDGQLAPAIPYCSWIVV